MKIKFVHLESEAFLTDLDYIVMSHAERSVYCTLIFYLTSNNGKCEYKPLVLSKLCHCENVEEFEEIWQGISKKFQTRNGVIKHKRVTKELRKAKNFRKACSEAGLIGAKKRWGGNSDLNRVAMAKERKGNVNEKVSKDPSNSNTSEQSLCTSSSLRSGADKGSRIRALQFNEALCGIIQPMSRSDRTCFRNVADWLVEGCASGRFTSEIFDRVLDYADQARRGQKPAAVFMALLKNELGYRPNSTKSAGTSEQK